MTETFLEHDQSTDSSIPVLEREDSFKLHVKVKNVSPINLIQPLVCINQSNKSIVNLINGSNEFLFSQREGIAVLAWSNLFLSIIHRSIHQKQVKLFDKLYTERFLNVVQHIVQAHAVVHDLNQIRDLHRLEALPNLSFPENGFHLISCEPIACHPARAVCTVDLHVVVESVEALFCFLLDQSSGKLRKTVVAGGACCFCFRLLCIRRNFPTKLSLAGSSNTSLYTVFADHCTGDFPQICRFFY